jgi:hypothetical protein
MLSAGRTGAASGLDSQQHDLFGLHGVASPVAGSGESSRAPSAAMRRKAQTVARSIGLGHVRSLRGFKIGEPVSMMLGDPGSLPSFQAHVIEASNR